VAIMQIRDRWAKERKLRSLQKYIRMDGGGRRFPVPYWSRLQKQMERRTTMSFLPEPTSACPVFRRVVRSTDAVVLHISAGH